MKFGLLFDNMVVETIAPDEGSSIEDYVSVDRVSDYINIPEHVSAGYTLNPDGVWVAPPLVS